MNLRGFDLDMLLAVAIEAEIESQRVYRHLARRSNRFMLRDRFNFLVQEEAKHETFLREVFGKTFPHRDLDIPERMSVRLPKVRYSDDTPASEIIEQAMEAERATEDYYLSMADLLAPEGNDELVKGLKYLANVERSHYHVLESELDSARISEDYDSYWEMMHVGP